MNRDVQLFTSTVTAVFLEASPVLLLGAVLSSPVEAYLKLLNKDAPECGTAPWAI